LKQKIKKKKRLTELQLQIDSLKDKLERKFPSKTLLDSSLIPRFRNSARPLSAKKPKQASKIPRLRSPLIDIAPFLPSPKVPNQQQHPNSRQTPLIQSTPQQSAQRKSSIDRSNSTPTINVPQSTPQQSNQRRSSIDRSNSTPVISNQSLPSYATPTTSSKRRSSVDRGTTTPTPTNNNATLYQTPNVKQNGQRPSFSRPNSIQTPLQTPPSSRPLPSTSTKPPPTSTTTTPGLSTSRSRAASTATPHSDSRPRRVSMPDSSSSNPLKIGPLVTTARISKPSQVISPPN